MQALAAELARLRDAGLYRQRRVVDGPHGSRLRLGGRELLNFCSNDYLGLANDPRIADAARRGLSDYGVGAGAAHLINGHSSAHHALEEELAEFTGRQRALLFSTGYMANLGVISALLGRNDSCVQDRLNHASLIDGAKLSGARLLRYRHGDMTGLTQQLGQALGETLIASDGVFSMDGDVVDLPALVARARARDAWLMIDDAHGFGVLGETGAGTCEVVAMGPDEVPILVGTLGKAFGTFGAFVAGSEDLIETLIQRARSYIYTTASPPLLAEATRASLRIVQTETWRRERLRELVSRFRAEAAGMGLTLMSSPTPIQPILLGDADNALRWSEALAARGIQVSAIRPPTVPEGGARLRLTLSAAHTDQQLDQLLQALHEVQRECAA